MKNSADEKAAKQRSLAVKTARSTILSCVLFGLVSLVFALVVYAVALTRQYINTADGIAQQAAQFAERGLDTAKLSEKVMNRYRSLTPEDRQKVGTEEYRAHFADLDIGQNSDYDTMIRILRNSLKYYDIFDVYVAMYDQDTDTLVYIIDPDTDPQTQFFPGEWESVEKDEVEKFLRSDEKSQNYDIGWTDRYGLLCTVGVPIQNEAGETVAFVLVDLSLKNIFAGMRVFALGFTAVMIVLTLLIAWLRARHIKYTLVQPINQIAEASLRLAEGQAPAEGQTDHFSDLGIHTGDELESLANNMASMEHSLKEYGTNLLKITAEKERIGTELSLARRIQASMLPHTFPPYPDRHEFDIYAVMHPAREVGGDFYDFFLIDDDHLGIVMADVSGKGVPAALFMMISKTILQSCAMLGRSAAEILTKTNEALCSNNQVEMFVTVWLGILEISTGKITAANAGHEYPVMKRKNGRFELYKDKHSLAVGCMERTKYKEYEIQLEAGDQLFLYTDGIPEATNADNQMFRCERMLAALNQKPDADPKTLLENVRAAVDAFVQEAEQFDDLTMLSITYRGSAEPEN